jgi:hypothetical protein
MPIYNGTTSMGNVWGTDRWQSVAFDGFEESPEEEVTAVLHEDEQAKVTEDGNVRVTE